MALHVLLCHCLRAQARPIYNHLQPNLILSIQTLTMPSMEEQILLEMISDRDKRMATIRRKILEQQTKQDRLRVELEQVTAQLSDEQYEQQAVRIALQHAHEHACLRLETLVRDLRQQGASLLPYAAVPKKAADPSPGHVMQMQAQLCKAMHSMGITDHQFKIAKMQSDQFIKMNRDELTALTEEKTKIELELMNELMKEDTEKRRVEAELLKQLDAIQKDVQAIQEQLEENEESENDDEADDDEPKETEEDDQEMKDAKQELMKMLQKQREKIHNLEKENKFQERRIARLKKQVEHPDASEFFEPSESEFMDAPSYDDDDEVEDAGSPPRRSKKQLSEEEKERKTDDDETE
jgi:chromosome segregation ATPase